MNKLILALTATLLLTACAEEPVKSESQLVFERFGFDTKGITFVDATPVPVNTEWSKIRFKDESEPGQSCTVEYTLDYWTHKAYCRKLDASNILDY